MVCGAPPNSTLPHAISKHAVCFTFLKLKDHVVFGKIPFRATKILIKEFAFIFPGTYLNFVFLWVWKLWGKLFSFLFTSILFHVKLSFHVNCPSDKDEHKAPLVRHKNTELVVINT